MEKTFSIGDAFREARAILKTNFWLIIGQYLLISLGLGIMFSVLFGRGALVGGIITGYIFAKWSLSYVRKGSFKYEDLFEGVTLTKFVYFICALFLVGISIVGGLLLLVIPGIIFAVRLSFVKYLIVEKDLKPMAALRESKRITKGNRWKLFWLYVVVFLVNLLGFICIIIGLFYTLPLTRLVIASVYKKLSDDVAVEEVIIIETPEEVIVETIEVVGGEA